MHATDQSPAEIANEAIFHAVAGASTLVIEGKSDRKLLRRLIDDDAIVLVPAGSKSGALAVLDILDDLESRGRCLGSAILILVDRDDDPVSGRSGRILRTRGRDLDSEVLGIPGILDRTISNVYDLPRQDLMSIRSGILARCHARRAVREASSELELGLSCRKLDLHELIPAEITPEVLADQLLPGGSGRFSELCDKLKDKLAEPIDVLMCQGHDLHLVISRPLQGWKGHHIQAMALNAVTVDLFLGTETGMALQKWSEERGRPMWRTASAA